nr:hypothetical protein 4 [bacterium]
MNNKTLNLNSGLLGGLFRYFSENSNFASKYIPHLKEEYFSGDRLSTIFSVYKSTYESGLNPLSLHEVLDTLPDLRGITPADYEESKLILQKIIENPPSQPIEFYEEATPNWIRVKRHREGLLEAVQLFDKFEHIPADVITRVLDSTNFSIGNSPTVSLGEDLESYFDRRSSKQESIPSGHRDMDNVLGGGFLKGTLNVFIAGTNSGKSAFMCNLTSNFIRNNKKVLYVTLEMSSDLIRNRVFANLTDLDMSAYDSDPDLYIERIRSLKGLNNLEIIELPTSACSADDIAQVLNDAESSSKKFVPDVVCVDYLALMNSTRCNGKNQQTFEIQKSISEELRGLAMKYNTVLLTGAQTNRNGYDKNNVGLTDIAGSFGINYTADTVFSMTMDERTNSVLMSCTKNRNGQAGKKFALIPDFGKMKYTDGGFESIDEEQIEKDEQKVKKVSDFAGFTF